MNCPICEKVLKFSNYYVSGSPDHYVDFDCTDTGHYHARFINNKFTSSCFVYDGYNVFDNRGAEVLSAYKDKYNVAIIRPYFCTFGLPMEKILKKIKIYITFS